MASYLIFGLQDESGEWRQQKRERLCVTMRRVRLAVRPGSVTEIGTTIGMRIRIDPFAPAAGNRHADAVLPARHRSHVDDCDDRLGVRTFAFIGKDALRRIITDNPAKP